MARASEERGQGRVAAGEDERRSPLAATIGLLVAFVVLAVVGVVTVVVPEVTDEGDEGAASVEDARGSSRAEAP